MLFKQKAGKLFQKVRINSDDSSGSTVLLAGTLHIACSFSIFYTKPWLASDN